MAGHPVYLCFDMDFSTRPAHRACAPPSRPARSWRRAALANNAPGSGLMVASGCRRVWASLLRAEGGAVPSRGTLGGISQLCDGGVDRAFTIGALCAGSLRVVASIAP